MLAGQDASRHGVLWAQAGHPHSNLQFLAPGALNAFGPRSGYGAVWRRDAIPANATSDPFHVFGYDDACLHLAHRSVAPVVFVLEADATGNDEWREFTRLEVPSQGFATHRFQPAALPAQWVRVRAGRETTASAYFHLHSPRTPTVAARQTRRRRRSVARHPGARRRTVRPVSDDRF